MQYVYLLRAGDYYKVGISHNVKSRVSILQSTNPEKIEIIATKFADTNAYPIEQEIHKSLEEMKSGGANEWFKLTPEQALEVAIKINNYPDIDISERVALNSIIQEQRRQQRFIEKKLDYVINTYQKIKPQPKVVEKVVEVVKEKPVPRPVRIVHDDEWYKAQALDVFRLEGRASTSLLQRKLKLGYGRAARIVELLEDEGFISHLDGAMPRKVLV